MFSKEFFVGMRNNAVQYIHIPPTDQCKMIYRYLASCFSARVGAQGIPPLNQPWFTSSYQVDNKSAGHFPLGRGGVFLCQRDFVLQWPALAFVGRGSFRIPRRGGLEGPPRIVCNITESATFKIMLRAELLKLSNSMSQKREREREKKGNRLWFG